MKHILLILAFLSTSASAGFLDVNTRGALAYMSVGESWIIRAEHDGEARLAFTQSARLGSFYFAVGQEVTESEKTGALLFAAYAPTYSEFTADITYQHDKTTVSYTRRLLRDLHWSAGVNTKGEVTLGLRIRIRQ